MGCDNRTVAVLSCGKTDFVKALSFFLEEGESVSYYAEDRERGLVFFRGETPPVMQTSPEFDVSAACPLPAPLGLEDVVRFVWGWLQTATFPEYPKHVDHAERGWYVYNREQDGPVGGYMESLFAVAPAWAEFYAPSSY